MSLAIRLRFALWLVASLTLGAVFLLGVQPQLKVETDLLKLLPQERDAAVDALIARSADRYTNRFVYLVNAGEFDATATLAHQLAAQLRAAPGVRAVELEASPEALEQLNASYAPHAGWLLSARQRTLLRTVPQQLLAQAQMALYSPAGWARRTRLADDPLGLLDGFLVEAAPNTGRVLPRDGVLSVSDGADTWVLVVGQLVGSPYSSDVKVQAAAAIDAADDLLAQTSAKVQRTGVVFHALHAAEQANWEMTWFGAGDISAALLVLLLLFRALTPVLLPQLVLAVGGVAAVSMCHWVFGPVHALTLVFGVSLIGLAVDYGAHYAADQLRDPRGWKPPQALPHVAPSLLLSVAATVLAYGALAAAPLPALRQMALFTATGLIISALGVLAVFPVLLRPSPATQMERLARFAERLRAAALRASAALSRPLVLALVLLFAVFGLLRLHFNDDVRLLAQSPLALQQQEQDSRRLLGNLPDSPYFLLRAANAEALLQAEEALRVQLDAAIADGALGNYAALSRALPSLAQQAADHALLARTVYATDGALDQFAKILGWPQTSTAAQRAHFETSTPQRATDWLASPAATGTDALWLGTTGQGVASQILLYGSKDAARLAALAGGSVHYIDRVAEISRQLTHFRHSALTWLAAALLAYTGLIALRYGGRDALKVAAVPAASALLTLAVFGWLGIVGNLFHVLGLLLVLGLGLDYAVFIRESRAAPATLLAVSLSALTTLLGFGLLAFSRTPFIASLGLTLALGIALTYGLATLVGVSANSENNHANPPSH